jgi:hypothetical protein
MWDDGMKILRRTTRENDSRPYGSAKLTELDGDEVTGGSPVGEGPGKGKTGAELQSSTCNG